VCLCREKATKKYYALKVLGIADVVRLKQVEHVRNEKRVLGMAHHPFIITM
jgi:protein kinase X